MRDKIRVNKKHSTEIRKKFPCTDILHDTLWQKNALFDSLKTVRIRPITPRFFAYGEKASAKIKLCSLDITLSNRKHGFVSGDTLTGRRMDVTDSKLLIPHTPFSISLCFPVYRTEIL